MRVLEDLWYGNIDTADYGLPHDQEYKELYGYEDEIRRVEAKVVAPIVTAHNTMFDGMVGGSRNESLCDIMAEFEDYGTQDIQACSQDEAEKFQRFIETQKHLIDEYLYYYPDPNAIEYQRALCAKQLLEENPTDFYLKECAHLKPNQFTGAYKY